MEFRALARCRWLVHAFSTRAGGISRGTPRGLNLGFIASDPRKNVEQNRRLFFAALGTESFSLATLKQVHSANIFRASAQQTRGIKFLPAGSAAPQEVGDVPPVGDALITDQAGILLSIRTADCFPVLIVDPRQRAIAALHAGWRGALGRIAEKVVGVMRGVFRSKPQDLLAAVGPGIRACCYEVGEEVVSAFRGRFVNSERFFKPLAVDSHSAALPTKYPSLFLASFPPGHASQHQRAANLDLVAVIQEQLLASGLLRKRIHSAEFCTACRTDLFFSHRKEGSRAGRMMAVIGIRPGTAD